MLRGMRGAGWFVMVLAMAGLCGAAARGQTEPISGPAAPVAANDVTWTSPGHDENDSMPLGNGDLAANIWTEPNGDIVLLLAKDDAWSELGQLLKLGRVRVRLTPNPFKGAAFRQTLHLEDGSIDIAQGDNHLRLWVDANHPVLHVETHTVQPVTIEARLEDWRTKTRPYSEHQPQRGGLFEYGGHDVPMDFEADTILPESGPDRVTWYHWNRQSVLPLIFKQEHVEQLEAKYPDRLLHRCFGAVITGPGLKAVNNHLLRSKEALKDNRVDVVALTQTAVADPETWVAAVDSLTKTLEAMPIVPTSEAHARWWSDFWQRSWIRVSGSPDAQAVSQGYAMQRYMMAASSRGLYPVKFNGGLFTVGGDVREDVDSTPKRHNPDFRAWGDSYWNQNNRLPYWPLVATGDFDLLDPWFEMYVKALPLAKDKTKIYYHHGGASFIETTSFWGLPQIGDFGWDNPKDEVESRWMRYHIQGSMEVIAEMLDEYDVTGNAEFASDKLVPLADAIVAYYGEHWPRAADGTIHMSPSQSTETYQLDAVNPTPDIAGLKSILPRLLALPAALTTTDERARWAKVLHDLPPIAMGTTAKGKIPPLGNGDADGKKIIFPAEKYGKTENVENPELYTVFPYRLYEVGKPDLELARNTYAARLFPQDTCWGQDGVEAALLGLTDEAKKAAIAEFTFYGDQRFQWFWRPGHDWIPDLDNGGNGMLTLQNMLMQTEGDKIILTPAWPKDWTADFRLHAPHNTVVEGHVQDGKVTRLAVTPPERKADVVMEEPQQSE
jgi:alpha-L-fucosidase 2